MSDVKPPTQLLSEIQSAKSVDLKDVDTNVGNLSGKHDMAMVGVERFDKNKLKQTSTVEKNVLPTADDIKEAKEAEKSP